jgi:hypothetical protein
VARRAAMGVAVRAAVGVARGAAVRMTKMTVLRWHFRVCVCVLEVERSAKALDATRERTLEN